MSTSILKRPGMRNLRRFGLLAVIVAAAGYLATIPTLILLACGALDVGRHKHLKRELLQKYFTGNGMLTWLLSPINLLADLLSYRNPGRYRLADLPPEHRAEIESCVRAFADNAELIKAHVGKTIGANRRAMLTFKWYSATQDTELRIPAFERRFRYIKTIAVSVFNTRERTSRHFGPLRLTFRVLYNLNPADSPDVFIEVDDQVHYWRDDPLFIFDDTLFHRSINDIDQVRYCLFMDIVRPNRLPALFNVAVEAASRISGSFKKMFYRNWSFIR